MSAPYKLESVRERFARNLKNWRSKRGISQELLAEQVGLSRGFLSRVETSDETLSLDNASELARALRVDIADLLLP